MKTRFLLILACGLTAACGEEPRSPHAQAVYDAALARVKAEREGGPTHATYERLSTGMRYDEVVSLIGREGREGARTSIGGATTVIYDWTEPTRGGVLSATFQNGALVSKVQHGLP